MVSTYILLQVLMQLNGESKEFELSMEQKTRLLKLGLDSGIDKTVSSEDDEMVDMLYDILASTLPADLSVVDSLPLVLRTMSGQLQSVTGKPIRKLLLSSETDLSVLRQIKNYAKQLGLSSGSEMEKEAYLAVYFVAIASALLFHDIKISQHRDEDLKDFFLHYINENWVTSEIVLIFQEALDKQ